MVQNQEMDCKSDLFDLAIVNSWFEYREDARKANMRKNEVIDLLAFRLSIVEYLLGGPTRKRAREDFELAPILTSSDTDKLRV